MIMIRRLFIPIILAISASVITTPAAPLSRMRFHCADDTVKLNRLLAAGATSDTTSPRKLMSFYAHELLGTPYVAHTLEGGSEMLTINIHELDCTTFIETLAALTITTLSGRRSWRDYAANLEAIRYRRGSMDGYASRLHYISDWIVDNTASGHVREITADFPRVVYQIKTIDYMSRHRDSYPSLADDAVFERIKSTEGGYRSHRFPVIKKGDLKMRDMRTVFSDGDIVCLVTKTDGLDVSHLGIIENVNGAPHLLHASSLAKKVIIDPLDLADMLQRSKTNIGIRIVRIVE